MCFGQVEDERTFFTLAIMKDKLCNQVGPHMEMTIWMFGQEFFTQNNFSYHDVIMSWKKAKKYELMLSLLNGCWANLFAF